ncbi:hypothetical protein ZWY2020_051142 [Hordeum vulgare]|nr:hypothetical protein ZWY2020_051142 [Hordeum vulgare]
MRIRCLLSSFCLSGGCTAALHVCILQADPPRPHLIVKRQEDQTHTHTKGKGAAGKGHLLNNKRSTEEEPFADPSSPVTTCSSHGNGYKMKSKIFFIAWSPAASRIRAKILYATSKQGLRRVLDGVHYEVQATDPSEMGFDVIRERAQ